MPLYRSRSQVYLFLSALLVVLVLNPALTRTQARRPGAQTNAPESAGPYNTLVIRDVTVIDGTGSPAQGPFDIVIKGNVISEVIPADPIRGQGLQRVTGDRVIEGKGMYVVPGLIDMHVHLSEAPGVPLDYVYKLLLAHGVTTARVWNIGNRSPQEMVTEQKKIAAHEVLAPRIYVWPFWARSGDRKDPRWSDPEGAREIVREWKALGVQGIKMTGRPGLYPDVLRSIADEARKNGMGVAVHIGQDGVFPMNAVNVADAGVSSIEHHYGYAEAAFSDKTIQDLPADYNYSSEPDRFFETGHVWLQTDLAKLHGQEIQQLLDISKRTGFTMVPTFVVYEGNRDVARVQSLPWHSSFSMPALLDHWLPNPAHHASFYYHWTSQNEAVWSRMFSRWLDFVNDYKNHGGAVALGSDAGTNYVLWGFASIRELEMMENAGFTALEALHSATQVGAVSLGNKRLGVIREGYTADLVLLAANPLEDMKVFYGTGITRTTQTGQVEHIGGVKYTIADGVVIDSQALLLDVQDMVARAKKATPASAAKLATGPLRPAGVVRSGTPQPVRR